MKLKEKKQAEETSLVPSDRECTRCDGLQVLVGYRFNMGCFVCDTCEMRVGYDLDSNPSEFLSHRGRPSYYTQERFGPQLLGEERRL